MKARIQLIHCNVPVDVKKEYRTSKMINSYLVKDKKKMVSFHNLDDFVDTSCAALALAFLDYRLGVHMI
jgi:hypothetical protein